MSAASLFPALVEIEEALAAPDPADAEPLRIAVLRDVTVEPIDSYLRYLARRDGMRASVTFGDFGSLALQASGGAPGLLNQGLDAVLVFEPLVQLSPALYSRFTALDARSVKEEVARVESLFLLVTNGIRRQTSAMILWHGLEPPVFPALGILDAQRSDGQAAIVAALNAALRGVLNAVPGAYMVDMAACLARVGARHFYDNRHWHLAQAPYARRGLAEIAAEDFKFIRGLKGKAKKCLVLDCDNTLWGGIVGEEGLGGIKLGQTYPGSPFTEFQHEVVSLFHRGVIIALCSRNNEADVWEVFDRHPEMILRREHVAAWRINWRDKATNLRDLAEDLGLGLDSMVLAEDSEFEAGLVRAQLPEVEILQLSEGDSVNYRTRLASCGFFDVAVLTDEDRARGAMYSADVTRRRSKSEASDLDSYYRSLQMRLEVGYCDEWSISRVAQLTQKTNQFNLATRRYGVGEIATFVESPRHDVLCARLVDRLGDLGIIGVCILEYAERQASIDTFLLSCRALGRGAEQKFLAEILHLACTKGAYTTRGEYVPTSKNAQVELFLLDNGFAETAVVATPAKRCFERPLAGLPQRARGHFWQIASPLGLLTDNSSAEAIVRD
jgi:FkbH-like protein